jgi:hypothetical protein
MRSAADILHEHGIRLQSAQPGRHYTTCPRCSASRKVHNQKHKCLGVTITDEGAHFGCSHCAWTGGGYFKMNGHKPEIVAQYEYQDENGTALSRKVRKPGKIFWWEHPDGRGGWTSGGGGARKVLYRLPELIEDMANSHHILIVEGEKDVDNVRRIGVPATCNPDGAHKPGETPKWRLEFSETLRGADIVIVPDNDPQGRAHADAIASMSTGLAKRIRLLYLAAHWPECPEGGDISDWLKAGHTREELDTLIEQAPNWQAGADKSDAADSLFDPWAEYIVPTFPLDILPPVAQEFVRAQSVLIGCDRSGMAMAVLATFSGSLSHRFALRMMRNGDWYENGRLWVLLVGDPSKKKTPIFNTATRPIVEHYDCVYQKYQDELRDYEAAKESDIKATEPTPPQRLVCSDITIEKLADILAQFERGLLVKRDEIAGWVGGMEKYASGRASASDRGFWLQAFDGGPYHVDRIKRGETYIRNLSVSLLGGIQPARLAELNGLTTDGLLQRFLPVMMGPSQLPVDEPSNHEDYSALVRKLIFAKPEKLILDSVAHEAMHQLRQSLHDIETAAVGLADGFQAFVGKLAGYAGRLALILHMAADPENGQTYSVNEKTVENVSRLIHSFIIPHAHEFYRTAESTTDGDRLRKIASWILTSGKTRIRMTDLTSSVRDLRGLTVLEVNKRVSPLVAGGWLEPAEPGPMCRCWAVAPTVKTLFEEQRQRQERTKAAIREIMGKSFALRREQKGPRDKQDGAVVPFVTSRR